MACRGRARRGVSSTRSSPDASTRAPTGCGFFKSVDHGKHWVRRVFGVGQPDHRRRGRRPGRSFGVRGDRVCRRALEEHRLRRHLHPHRPRPGRASRRVPGLERPRDHGRSAQPHHRLLRRPRHRHLAIAGRRRELGQRRPERRAECDRRPDRLQHRLRGFSVRRRAQEHRRRRVVHRRRATACRIPCACRPPAVCAWTQPTTTSSTSEPSSTACSRARTARRPGCRSVWASTASG